jgi:hypothetical protein
MSEPAAKREQPLKITVVLLQRHVAALDHLAVSIRLKAGVSLSRAGIIGAFVEAAFRRPRAEMEELLQKRVSMNKDRKHKGSGA